MKKVLKKIAPILFLLFLLYPLGNLHAFGEGAEGVTLYDEDAVYDGLTLITPQSGENGPSGNNEIYLIDIEGEIVHTWSLDESGEQFAEMLEDGTLLYRFNTSTRPGKFSPKTGAIQEIDWEGNILWEYTNDLFHHDFAKLPNGNILAILWEQMTDENVDRLPNKSTDSDETVWVDKIVEIDYYTQEIVWEWKLQDELDIESYSLASFSTEWTHVNAVDYLPEGNPYNSVPSVILSSHDLNSVFIVEMETGDIAWAWGPDELDGQHDPTLLENGNVLIFDNGSEREFSRVIEVDPVTDEIVWEYKADGFFASRISGAQRLPNGNTLITSGPRALVFEVNPDGDVLWDYWMPHFGGDKENALFRAYRFGPYDIDWPENLFGDLGETEDSSNFLLGVLLVACVFGVIGVVIFLLRQKHPVPGDE